MRILHLTFLGGFKISWDARQEVLLKGKKARALLAYLALNPDQGHSREKLATLLWGDRLDEQARHSLRQSLLALRKALGGDKAAKILSDNETLQLKSGEFELDVRAFENLAAEATPEALQQAADHYRGELLQELNTDSEGFDGWLADERARLHDLAWQVLERLAAHHAKSGAENLAIEAGKQLVALDPLREEGHRLLMGYYHCAGERSAALKQYHSCVARLRKELDADPEPETTRLYEEIKTQKVDSGSDAASPPKADSEIGGMKEPLALPEKPSIAVLPFTNMSGDPEQEYFSKGITEDIITDLSRLERLFVIDWNSSFTYEDQHVDVRRVGEELGVRYVLEGSVRKSGERVRITAQLIDTANGEHLWAHRYDRELQDIFAIQDEITRDIAAELEVKLVEGEQARRWWRSTNILEAYDLAIRGRDLSRNHSKAEIEQGRRLIEQALELDPNFCEAMVLLGWTYHVEGVSGRSKSARACFEKAIELGTRAIELDESSSSGFALLSFPLTYIGKHDRALECIERALEIHPANADANATYSNVLGRFGRGKEALERIETALRLNPFPPHWYLRVLGSAHRNAGHYEKAITGFRRCVESLPEFMAAHVEFTLTYMEAGLKKEGSAQALEVLRINPKFTVTTHPFVESYKDPATRKRYTAMLVEAGLPE